MNPKHAVFHQLADLRQRLVLDLADTFLGHADDLADFFQSQRSVILLSQLKRRRRTVCSTCQLGEIAIDDLLEFVDAILFDHVALSTQSLFSMSGSNSTGKRVRCLLCFWAVRVNAFKIARQAYVESNRKLNHEL